MLIQKILNKPYKTLNYFYKFVKMKLITSILITIISLPFFAQQWVNVTSQYIQNPSFEEYTACPQSNSDYPNSMWIDSVVGWYAPTQATPDYFNVCNTIGNGIPSNYTVGFQFPFDGNAYCGFLAYVIDLNYQMWSEYIQTKLIQNLQPNTSYKFTMRINRANNYNFAVQNIGVNFSELNMNNFSTTSPFNIAPTVLNNTGFLVDTMGWTLVEGEFKAVGNENYLTIGWFGDTITSDFSWFIPPDIDPISGDSLFLTETYYAVDSINLFEQIFDIENFSVNAITPNGDNQNDVLDFSSYKLKGLYLEVLNRWGNAVFQSDNPNLIWNGKDENDNNLSDGIYFYKFIATTQEGKVITKHNFISIFN